MRWRRRPAVPFPKHRGRVWFDGSIWRWSCNDCDYGAGGKGSGRTLVPFYVHVATLHARAHGPEAPH